MAEFDASIASSGWRAGSLLGVPAFRRDMIADGAATVAAAVVAPATFVPDVVTVADTVVVAVDEGVATPDELDGTCAIPVEPTPACTDCIGVTEDVFVTGCIDWDDVCCCGDVGEEGTIADPPAVAVVTGAPADGAPVDEGADVVELVGRRLCGVMNE